MRGKINTCKVVRYEWICCCQFEFRLSKIRGAIIAHQLKIWNATPKRMWRGWTMLNDHNVRLNRNVRLILRRWYGMPMPMPFTIWSSHPFGSSSCVCLSGYETICYTLQHTNCLLLRFNGSDSILFHVCVRSFVFFLVCTLRYMLVLRFALIFQLLLIERQNS